MKSQHTIYVLDHVHSTITSAKPIHLDQSLCLGLAEYLKFASDRLTEVQDKIDSVERQYPDMFRELYMVACRAHMLVERCCSEEWLRILFLQACTSHKEEALDVIDDLEWCIVEVRKILALPRQQSQALIKFKRLLKECEDLDGCQLLKKLESHACTSLERQELQLTKYLLGRVKVQVDSSIPPGMEVSLDYRNFNLTRANGLTGSEFVGQGSSAKVYKTKFLEIQCAKKVQTTDSADKLQHLARQARKLATLSHPHVMKLFGFYGKQTDEGIYEGHLLMDFMDGNLLENIRQCLNQYPIAVDFMLQIAKGVRYLHLCGIAHRDLKCSNVLVSKSPISSKFSSSTYKDDFHIKVADFDQSKFYTSNCSDLQVQSRHYVGSTAWKAPEAFPDQGESSGVMVNPKLADTYSFAMMCFELLSGENPFDAMPGISWTKAKEALVSGRRPPLPKNCPQLLRDLIVECWRTNPNLRPDFPEICRRLKDVRAFLLTGSLTRRNKQRDAPSFLWDNAQRVVSVFKIMRRVATTTRKRIPVVRVATPEMQEPLTHSDIIENMQQVPEGDLLHTHEPRTLTTAKVVVGLDFGTTHTGVAYAMVSNPNEIFTISHWPLVGEEVYHCKTLTAMYKPSQNDDYLWGYPARREYEKNIRENGQNFGSGSYFGELKQSLLSNCIGPDDYQPVVEYLRELGKFVLSYLQREYPQEFLEMDFLRWCISVPSNWGSDFKQKLSTYMRDVGLVRGQTEHENYSSNLEVFLESDAAACYCSGYFAHVNMKKGDRLCVLDVGGGNVQCIFEEWEGANQWSYEGSTQKIYGARSLCIESLVQKEFLNFILGEDGCYSCRQLLRDDPSVRISLLDELESLKVDLNHSIRIPCHLMTQIVGNRTRNHLENSTVMGDHHGNQCSGLNTQPIDELCPSSSDTKSIFKPLVDGVLSFLQEQLQSKPTVKRLFVVGGYAKHVYLMDEIRKSFPKLKIDMPKNPGSAVCKGAVALGLKAYFEFQAGLLKDTSLNSEGGEQGTNPDVGKSDGDKNQDDQPESFEKANPNCHSHDPRFGNTSDTKVDSKDPMDVDLPREKMLVALDFGTSQMGFSYGLGSRPAEITICKDNQRRTTDLYYKIDHDKPRLYSCGQKVRDAIVEDFNQQTYDSWGFVRALAMGAYVSKPKLHLLVDKTDPELELHLPASLTIDEVISDCLREYGHFILEQLQEKFGNDFQLHHIQWCLLVPSFWGENTKRRMEACMINAGLLKGLSSVDGSPYLLVTVLEAEAASMACIDSLISLRKGYKFLVASIGGGTLDMVIQEWVGESGMYDMKEVSMSSGGLYGSSCLDLNFLALLSMKMGTWVRDYLEQSPLLLIDVMLQWEQIKVEYSDDCKLKLYTLRLPMQVQNAWRSFNNQSATLKAGTSYETLELTSNDVKMVFEPIVQTILELITSQLATSFVDALVVVGGFAKSPYLYEHIIHKFGDQCLIWPVDTESVALKGAILFAQHPRGIRARVARKTYGIGMSTNFSCQTGEISNEVERFRIDVQKGSCVGVDYFVESYHKSITRGQESMNFTLYSSIESYPLYTGEQSVTKEWDFVVDISDSVKLEEEPKIRIRLYYGRSVVQVVAEAMNFGNGNHLPVTFAVGAHNARKLVDASVAKKTYGVGARKSFEIWDLPEYHSTSVDQGDMCDFNFDIYIQRGSPLDSSVSKTYHPIYNKQRSLAFTLFSSTDVTPRYTTDDTVKEEGEIEIDIVKGLYLDMDREISLRMYFTRNNIKISAAALNFAGENRNLPIRLCFGKWEREVSLILTRQFRIVPLQAIRVEAGAPFMPVQGVGGILDQADYNNGSYGERPQKWSENQNFGGHMDVEKGNASFSLDGCREHSIASQTDFERRSPTIGSTSTQFGKVEHLSPMFQDIELTYNAIHGLEKSGNAEYVSSALLKKKKKNLCNIVQGMANENPTSSRVFLCGEPYAGKTTLRMSMKRWIETQKKEEIRSSQRFGKMIWNKIEGPKDMKIPKVLVMDEHTRGIKVDTIFNDGIGITIWDMAGQSDYHSFHELVMPNLSLDGSSSLFLLVCNPMQQTFPWKKRRPSQIKSEIESWLRFIASNIRRSQSYPQHVSIVMTHFDYWKSDVEFAECIGDVVLELKSQFQKVLEFDESKFVFKVDGTNVSHVGDVFNSIKTYLKALLQKLPKTIRACEEVQHRLIQWNVDFPNQPMLQWDEFCENLCKEVEELNDIDDELAKRKKEFVAISLNDGGHIIYNEEGGVIITNPHWFCHDIMGQFLQHCAKKGQGLEMVSRNGIISIDHLKRFLLKLVEGQGDTKKWFDGILRIMEKLHVCYKQDDDHILVPSTLKDDHQNLKWSQNLDSISFTYIGRQLACKDDIRTMMSPGFFARLQVSFFQKFQNNNVRDSYELFLNVIKFICSGIEVIIQFNDGDIDILLRSHHCHHIMLEFLKNDIVKHIKNLQLDPTLGCPGVLLEEFILRPACVKELINSKLRKNQIVSMTNLEMSVVRNGIAAVYNWKPCEGLCSGSDKVKTLLGDMAWLKLLERRSHELQRHHKEISLTTLNQNDSMSCKREKDDTSWNTSNLLQIPQKFRTPLQGNHTNSHWEEVKEKLDNMDKNMDDNYKEVMTKLDVVVQRLEENIVTLQNDLLHEVCSKIDDLMAFSVEMQKSQIPKLAYFTETGKKELLTRLVPNLKRLQLRLMCENRDGFHEVVDQEGYEVKINTQSTRRFLNMLDWGLKIATILIKIGAHVGAGMVGMVPNFSDGGTFAALILDTPGLLPDYRSLKLNIDGESRLEAEEGLRDILEPLCREKREFYKAFRLKKVSYRRASRSIAWICDTCITKEGDQIDILH